MLSDTMLRKISIDTAKIQPLRSELTLVGRIIADENRVIEVFPLVGGNVESVKIELGDYVRKGQTLATIRSGEVADFERQNTQAEAEGRASFQIDGKMIDVPVVERARRLLARHASIEARHRSQAR